MKLPSLASKVVVISLNLRHFDELAEASTFAEEPSQRKSGTSNLGAVVMLSSFVNKHECTAFDTAMIFSCSEVTSLKSDFILNLIMCLYICPALKSRKQDVGEAPVKRQSIDAVNVYTKRQDPTRFV